MREGGPCVYAYVCARVRLCVREGKTVPVRAGALAGAWCGWPHAFVG